MTVAQAITLALTTSFTVAVSATAGSFCAAVREAHPALWEAHLHTIRWVPGTSPWALSRFLRSPAYAQVQSPRIRSLGTRLVWIERTTAAVLLALLVYSVFGVLSTL
jgi:hypothetical protein